MASNKIKIVQSAEPSLPPSASLRTMPMNGMLQTQFQYIESIARNIFLFTLNNETFCHSKRERQTKKRQWDTKKKLFTLTLSCMRRKCDENRCFERFLLLPDDARNHHNSIFMNISWQWVYFSIEASCFIGESLEIDDSPSVQMLDRKIRSTFQWLMELASNLHSLYQTIQPDRCSQLSYRHTN